MMTSLFYTPTCLLIMTDGGRRCLNMSSVTQKQECLVVCYCTQQQTRVANITYNVQEENSQTIDQITSEVGWYLKTGELLSQNWKLIQDNTIPREKLLGQHLEVATLDGNLSIPLATLTPPMNGLTTETSIIAYQEDKLVSTSIRYLYDSITMNPEITNE